MFGTASRWLLIPLTLLLFSSTARGADTLCDPATSNCRTQVLTLIQNERVGIDVGFWFMQDSRYMVEIVKRRQAGVPVRILMDPRASVDYAGNDTMLAGFAQAGIPMRKRIASGIQHWKMMLFAGQNTVQFGSANYSPDAFVPSVPYTNYVSETVFVTDDPAVVNSFKTKFDDWWTDTVSIANYANITAPLARVYPTYPIDPSMNFPPQQDYANRAVGRYNAESLKIDVIMFRITDQRHTNAMIAAHNRGVPVRMIVDIGEYRQPARLWDSWNVDRLYMAGIPLRWQGHAGDNHEKLVLLYGQNMTIFGSSNWTTASANSQQEHNYFTTKNAIFQWFATQFDRMWNNDVAVETAPFVPLPPDAPKNKLAGRRLAAAGGDDREADLVRRPVGAQLRRLFRHHAEAAAGRGEPEPRAELDHDDQPVLYDAGAGGGDDLLLADRVEDDGQPVGAGAGVELHDAGGPARPLAERLERERHRRGWRPWRVIVAGRHVHGRRFRRRCVGHGRRVSLHLSVVDR